MTEAADRVQGAAWMMPMRVLSAFTNIAGPYFILLPQVVLKPHTVGRAVGTQTPILPAHAYMAYGFGLLFFAYYVSAKIRGGDTNTFALSVIDYGLAFVGAFTFAGALRIRSKVDLSFADAAAIYLYAFSTFTIAALIAVELARLIIAAPTLARPVASCPTRSLDCLILASGGEASNALWESGLRLVFGLAGIVSTIIMTRSAATVTARRLALALLATFVVNAAVDRLLIEPMIDGLKAIGGWR